MKIQFTDFDTVSAVVKTFALTLKKVSGNFKGVTADRWLQLHDAKALPADTSVPIRSFPIYQSAPFSWAIEEGLEFANGLVVAVSTTEDTLTISTDKMDVYVDAESTIDDTGWAIVGDYTTGDDDLDVWTDNQGPRLLTRLEATNLTSGGNLYMQVFAHSPSEGDQCLVEKYAGSESVEMNFGTGGWSPSRHQTPNLINDGCYVRMSYTAGVLTQATDLDYALKATYKTS